MQELNRGLFVVHPYIIQETATVLAYKQGYAIAVDFLLNIENSTNTIIPSLDIRSDMKNFILLKKKISFADAALIALAQELKAQLITFDRQILSIFKKQ